MFWLVSQRVQFFFLIYRQCTYNIFIMHCQNVQNNFQVVRNKRRSDCFRVSSTTSALILLPFLTVALHESGIRKAIFWSVTLHNKHLSSQCAVYKIRTKYCFTKSNLIRLNRFKNIIAQSCDKDSVYQVIRWDFYQNKHQNL